MPELCLKLGRLNLLIRVKGNSPELRGILNYEEFRGIPNLEEFGIARSSESRGVRNCCHVAGNSELRGIPNCDESSARLHGGQNNDGLPPTASTAGQPA
jgi:hypothetical protein